MTGYRFERLSEERLPDLKYLYKDAFAADVSIEFLKMKYDTAFTGIQYVGYVAYDSSGKPAAYYGIFPLFAEHKDKTILAAQSGDTMTHSAHRGKGLFFSLAGETYKLAADLEIKFVYGFPNQHNSYHGLIKLKWTHNGNMRRYRIFVPAIPISIPGVLENTYQKRSDKILSKNSGTSKNFDNPIPQNEYIVIKRDSRYFEYKKYFKKYIIDINGKCVYVKAGRILQAGDIESCTESEFYNIIAKLKIIAFKIGAPALMLQFSPGIDYDRFLKKKYKAAEGIPICYLDLAGGLDLSKLRFSMADFDTF